MPLLHSGTARPRRATALVLALVLLTALLLLGLPFLVSQSASVRGVDTYAGRTGLTIAQENAAHAGAAVAALALAPAQAVPAEGLAGAAWTALPASLSPLRTSSHQALVTPIAAIPEQGDGSVQLSAAFLGTLVTTGSGPARPGATTALLCDESGRLDPNHLSSVAWGRLLAAVGIQDWNDAVVYPSPGPMPPGGYPPGTYVPSADGLGQLAKALAGLPSQLPSGQVRALAQLRIANPQLPPGTSAPGWTKLRWPLTQAELDRLAPFLTLSLPAPGRRGLQDLGTLIQQEPVSGTLWLDSLPDPLAPPLLGVGTTLVATGLSPASSVAPLQAIGLPAATPAPAQLAGQDLSQGLSQGLGTPSPGTGTAQAVWIATGPSVNLHQIGPVVRTVLGGGTALPVPPAGGVVTTLGALWACPAHVGAADPVASTHLSAWLDPAASGAELPPLAIASPGIVRITAAASLEDPFHRLLGVDQATRVVQAVPQEQLLQARWLTQGDLAALTAGRWTSRLQSWPVAIERLTDAVPADADLSAPATTAGAIAPLTGLRPRPLPSEALVRAAGATPGWTVSGMTWPLEQEPIDWRVGMGARAATTHDHVLDAESLGTAGVGAVSPPLAAAALPTATDLRPDGFHVAPGTTLAYSLRSSSPDGVNAAPSALLLPRPGSLEVGARQFGLWVRPEQDWSSGIHPLLSVRMPAANAGLRVDGTATDPDGENALALAVDADRGLLILALAPPTIPVAGDGGPGIGAADPTDLALDRQCLAGGLPLCPDSVADHGAGMRAFSALWSRGRVLHCLATPASGGTPFFRAGQWYHLQVALASDRPEGVALLIDGLCGQDGAAGAGAPHLTSVGDAFTLPGMVLTQALPAVPVGQTAPLFLAAVGVAGPAGLTAQALLPATGIVRIDDEYLRYGSLAPDGQHLLQVQRGYRQDWHAASSDPAQAQPATQAHAAGALVLPGGYHLDLPDTAPAGAMLYRGGCALADGLGDGDPGFPAAPGATWVGLGTSGVLPPTTTVLTVDPTKGVWTQFPPQGVVVLDGVALRYTATTATTLQGLAPIAATGLQLVPGGILPGGIHGTGLATQPGDPIVLVSCALTGPSPLDPGRYTLRAAIHGSAFLAAVEDASGATEWIAYDGVLAAPTPGTSFLIAATGFSDARRGQCRTPLLTHAAGALLEPVQTELGNAGHWMATGDAVTLLPQPTATSGVAAPSQVPVQVLVRTAATCGLPGANGTTGTPVEAPGDYVAFQGPIPDSAQDPQQPAQQGLLCAHWQLLCGTAWSGDDLSPGTSPLLGMQRCPQPRGCLPRMDAWCAAPGTGGTLGDDPRVVVLAEDPLAPAPRTSDATVDDLHAGGLTHPGLGIDGHESGGTTPNAVVNGIRLFWIGGQPSATLPATADLTQVVVQATTPLFAPKTPGGPRGLGLVRIDGETFAYGPPSPADASAIEAGAATLQAVAPNQGVPPPAVIAAGGSFAHLLARGLLSDAPPRDHVIGSGSLADNPSLPDGLLHTPVLSAIALPLGPVRLLDGGLAGTAWWGLLPEPDGVGSPLWASLVAPLALIVSPDGSHREVVQPIGPHRADGATPSLAGGYCTPPWLRGLYHTGLVTQDGTPDWAGAAGSLRPVVIGWWPRYPSALARTPTARSQELRSRSLPWASFPVAVVGAYADASLLARLPAPFSSMAMLRVPVTADALFQVEVRAMGAAPVGQPGILDWARQQPAFVPAASGSDPADATAACQPSADGTQTLSRSGTGAPSDGIEVRVDWTYVGAPSTRYEDIAAAGNRAPTIQGAQVRYLAPMRELASVPAGQ